MEETKTNNIHILNNVNALINISPKSHSTNSDGETEIILNEPKCALLSIFIRRNKDSSFILNYETPTH